MDTYTSGFTAWSNTNEHLNILISVYRKWPKNLNSEGRLSITLTAIFKTFLKMGLISCTSNTSIHKFYPKSIGWALLGRQNGKEETIQTWKTCSNMKKATFVNSNNKFIVTTFNHLNKNSFWASVTSTTT